MKKHTLLLRALPVLCLSALLTSCQTGGSSLPARKKMPEFNTNDAAFEGRQPFRQKNESYDQPSSAFAATNVDLMVGGTSQAFVQVTMPDATTDLATVSLLHNLKPFALPLLANWAKQQRHGVAIDLSSHTGEEIHRTDFQLEQSNIFIIPVVVMWDRSSAYRLNTLKSLAAEIPAIRFNQTSAE